MIKKITLPLLIPFVAFAANTDLIKELKQLKPLNNSGVEIKKVVDSGSVYILKLKVKDNRGVKYVPAAVTKDKKHVVIGTTYNAKTGDAEGVADLSKFEKDEAFSFGDDKKGGDFYVFTDPDCPACKSLEKQIVSEGLDKYGRIHVFFYPLDQLHPEARQKCEYVLSLPKEKRAEAYKKIQGGDISWKTYKATAEIKQQMAIGSGYAHELGLKGTPSFFDKSGNEIDGRIFISYLRAIKRNAAPQKVAANTIEKDNK